MDRCVKGCAVLKDALVMIVNSHRKNLLGLLLADDVLVELAHDFRGLRHANRGLLFARFVVELLIKDPFADGDATVTDVNAGSGDELANLRVAFATKGAHCEIARPSHGNNLL